MLVKPTTAEKFLDFTDTRNLETTPYNIPDLDVDDYNYDFFIQQISVNHSGIAFELNGSGVATNYNQYLMRGLNTTPDSNTTQGLVPYFIVSNSQSSIPSFSKIRVTSDVGEPTILDWQQAGNAGGFYSVKGTAYFTPTANVTSILVHHPFLGQTTTFHIVGYRTPKTGSTKSHWEAIGELEWSAENVTKIFDNLDGDVDGQYKLVSKSDVDFSIRFNANASAVYQNQRMFQNGASGNNPLQGAFNTETLITIRPNGSLIINPRTGQNRSFYSSSSNTAGVRQSERFGRYTEAATNITSIHCLSTAVANAKLTLYRKIDSFNSGELPWELISNTELVSQTLPDFTIPIQGNQFPFLRVEYDLVSNNDISDSFSYNFNGVTTGHHNQRFAATSAFALAQRNEFPGVVGITARESYGDSYFYTKMPNAETVMISNRNNVYGTIGWNAFASEWWPAGGASELTSLRLFQTGLTGGILHTGYIRVWRLA